MKTMTLAISMGLALAISTLAAAPAGNFKISTRKKTVDKDKSAVQELPRGSTRIEEKKIVYEFEIRNQSTTYSDQELKVRWVVLLEGPMGRSHPTAPGEKLVTLPFGRPVTVETDEVLLSERTWDVPAGRSGAAGAVLRGYGLQILTLDGQVLAEEYDPSSLRDDVDWTVLEKKPQASEQKITPPPARRNLLRDRRDQNVPPAAQ